MFEQYDPLLSGRISREIFIFILRDQVQLSLGESYFQILMRKFSLDIPQLISYRDFLHFCGYPATVAALRLEQPDAVTTTTGSLTTVATTEEQRPQIVPLRSVVNHATPVFIQVSKLEHETCLFKRLFIIIIIGSRYKKWDGCVVYAIINNEKTGSCDAKYAKRPSRICNRASHCLCDALIVNLKMKSMHARVKYVMFNCMVNSPLPRNATIIRKRKRKPSERRNRNNDGDDVYLPVLLLLQVLLLLLLLLLLAHQIPMHDPLGRNLGRNPKPGNPKPGNPRSRAIRCMILWKY